MPSRPQKLETSATNRKAKDNAHTKDGEKECPIGVHPLSGSHAEDELCRVYVNTHKFHYN